MSDKDFNKFLDRYLTEEVCNADDYQTLTQEQMFVIQTIKRAFKRIRAKYENNIQITS